MIAPLTEQGEARAVNARGDVAGQLNGAAFICHDGQILTYAGVQYFELGDVYSSIATAINDYGVAAGSDGGYFPCSMSGLEFATAVVFRDGKMDYVDRSRDGTCSFEVDGINNAGVLVGENSYRGFVRYSDGHEIEVRPLSTRPEYNGTRASALDNEGHVVGGTSIDVENVKYIAAGTTTRPSQPPEILRAPYTNSYVIHAFLATFASGHQRMRDLGGLPNFPNSYATAINENLTIVGYSGTESGPKWTRVSGPSHAWVWQHGHMTDLGARIFQNTYAYGVNNAGIVVGCSGVDAVRWADKHFQDLNALIGPDSGWHLSCARAINRAGIIVGWGTYQGLKRPFRLVPSN
jgi:probable HAF family extracellular repeat protein